MDGKYSPYRKGYRPYLNIKNIIIISISIIVVVSVILFITSNKNRSKLEKFYIGKVVEITGDIKQFGLVSEFHANDYIQIIPLNKKNRNPVYQKLKGKYSINIIAEDEIQYIKSKRKKSKTITNQKEKSSISTDNKVASLYTDNDKKKLIDDLNKLRNETKSKGDIKKELNINNKNGTKSDNEIINKDSKTISENLSDIELENEILDKIEQEFQDVYKRIYKMFFLGWDEFIMGCLVSNTSKAKYSKGRRWFLYLEDLVQRADELEKVGDKVELEPLKSIYDPRPYKYDKVRYLDTTGCRMQMTNLFEKIRYIKETFEWSKDFATKNGVHFSRIKNIWNSCFEQYSEWYDLVVEWEKIEKSYKIFHAIEKPMW